MTAAGRPRRGAGRLGVTVHDRDAAGYAYVYPVVSRRAGGVSIGINLNPNKACNWRCIYCQVPGLVRGRGPAIDLGRLRAELDAMLDDVLGGDFLRRRAPRWARRLADVAFSGDGEPTTSPSFPGAVGVVERALAARGLAGRVPVVLITNGSMTGTPAVRAAIARLAALGGEVWFKIDRATAAGARHVHSVPLALPRHLARLRAVAARCPTWIQTCVFAEHGAPPAPAEQDAYVAMIAALAAEGVPLRGVQLYGIARAPRQPEAPALSRLPATWLHAFARRIRAAGVPVVVRP